MPSSFSPPSRRVRRRKTPSSPPSRFRTSVQRRPKLRKIKEKQESSNSSAGDSSVDASASSDAHSSASSSNADSGADSGADLTDNDVDENNEDGADTVRTMPRKLLSTHKVAAKGDGKSRPVLRWGRNPVAAGTMDSDSDKEAGLPKQHDVFVTCPLCKQWVASSRLGGIGPDAHSCSRERSVHTDYWVVFRCAQPGCGQLFNGLSNMGNHRCRKHTGTYDEEKGYSCCGKKRMGVVNKYTFNMVWSRNQHEPIPIEPRGCTPCDHFHPDMPERTNLHAQPVRLQGSLDLPPSVQGNMDPLPVHRKGYFVGKDGQPYLRGISVSTVTR